MDPTTALKVGLKVDADAASGILDAGHNQADAAPLRCESGGHFQRVKQARIATSKVVALERAAHVVDQQLTAAQRLQHVQRVILDELARAEQHAKQPGVDRAALSDVSSGCRVKSARSSV